jgi:2-iminobutanoate/2-iminopropanoate deaminase
MERVVVFTEDAPRAIGPYRQEYHSRLLFNFFSSQAIKYGGVTYVSGCIGLSKETGALVHGGIEEETRQALENLKSIVLASGSDLSRVLKTTILLADMQYFKAVNDIYAEYFPTDPPARATFAVLGLPAGALIEIECVCADRID